MREHLRRLVDQEGARGSGGIQIDGNVEPRPAAHIDQVLFGAKILAQEQRHPIALVAPAPADASPLPRLAQSPSDVRLLPLFDLQNLLGPVRRGSLVHHAPLLSREFGPYPSFSASSVTAYTTSPGNGQNELEARRPGDGQGSETGGKRNRGG